MHPGYFALNKKYARLTRSYRGVRAFIIMVIIIKCLCFVQYRVFYCNYCLSRELSTEACYCLSRELSTGA